MQIQLYLEISIFCFVCLYKYLDLGIVFRCGYIMNLYIRYVEICRSIRRVFGGLCVYFYGQGYLNGYMRVLECVSVMFFLEFNKV